jgi:hypothetical protein
VNENTEISTYVAILKEVIIKNGTKEIQSQWSRKASFHGCVPFRCERDSTNIAFKTDGKNLADNARKKLLMVIKLRT